jgi:hypothetical protein
LKMIFLTFLNFLFLNIASACSPNWNAGLSNLVRLSL